MVNVKKYYQKIERIDYINFYDSFKGNESILIRARQRELETLIDSYVLYPLVDVGCGTGIALRDLPEGSVGLDLNPWNIKRAKKHVPSAHLVVGDAENLPFRSDSFSTAICSEVLEHLENPKKALKEINQCLKKGGFLLGSVPHPSWIWSLNDAIHKKLSNKKLRRVLSKIRFISSEESYDVPFHMLYTDEQFHQLFSSFKILKSNHFAFGLWISFVLEKK